MSRALTILVIQAYGLLFLECASPQKRAQEERDLKLDACGIHFDSEDAAYRELCNFISHMDFARALLDQGILIPEADLYRPPATKVNSCENPYQTLLDNPAIPKNRKAVFRERGAEYQTHCKEREAKFTQNLALYDREPPPEIDQSFQRNYLDCRKSSQSEVCKEALVTGAFNRIETAVRAHDRITDAEIVRLEEEAKLEKLAREKQRADAIAAWERRRREYAHAHPGYALWTMEPSDPSARTIACPVGVEPAIDCYNRLYCTNTVSECAADAASRAESQQRQNDAVLGIMGMGWTIYQQSLRNNQTPTSAPATQAHPQPNSGPSMQQQQQQTQVPQPVYRACPRVGQKSYCEPPVQGPAGSYHFCHYFTDGTGKGDCGENRVQEFLK